MNLDALLRVFYLDVYEFEVYDPFSRPQTRILRGIAVVVINRGSLSSQNEEDNIYMRLFLYI